MKYHHLEKLERFEAYNPSAAALRAAARRPVVEAETLTRRQRTVSWICQLIAAGIMIETLFYKSIPFVTPSSEW